MHQAKKTTIVMDIYAERNNQERMMMMNNWRWMNSRMRWKRAIWILVDNGYREEKFLYILYLNFKNRHMNK